MSDTLLQLLGRLHPMVLHLPIGLLVGLLAIEAWNRIANRRSAQSAPGAPVVIVLWLTILGLLMAAGTGLLLAREQMHPQQPVEWHRNLALVLTGVATVAGLLHAVRLRSAYLCTLVIAAILMIPAAHLGASLTHGDQFLLAPFTRGESRPVVQSPQAGPTQAAARTEAAFDADILPIFDAYCVKCHGPTAHKGGLQLDSWDAVFLGANYGPVVVPGDSQASELMLRMRLPLDDDDHMPPAKRAQPSEREVDLLAAWIDAGIPDKEPFALPAHLTSEAERSQPAPAPDGSAPLPRAEVPDPSEVERLVDALVHVAPIEPGVPNLWIDFAPVAPFIDDASFAELIGPLAPSIGELHAARADIGDPSMQALREAKALTTLDISWTRVTGDGLASLGSLSNLRTLKAAGLALDDEAIQAIASIGSLRTVYVWRSTATADQISTLRSRRPNLSVVSDAHPDDALDAEVELTFSSDRPLPDAPPDSTDTPNQSLVPVNTSCPVSGAPIDPAAAIIHEGRVIAFCCTDCLKSFIDNPARYALNLPAD